MFDHANLMEAVKYIKRGRSRNQILKVNFKELRKAKTEGQKSSAFIQSENNSKKKSSK